MSDNNIYEAPVIAAASVSAVVSLALFVGQALGADSTPMLPLASAPLGIALGVYVVGRWTTRPKRSENVALTPPRMRKEESTSKYCKDCGQLFTMRQKQEGFDPETGKPRLSFELGCPDADPSKTSLAYNNWGRYPMGGPPPDPYLWPNCGETKIRALTPVGHNHTQAEVKTDCPKCIEDMLSTGIIDLPGAKKLMSTIR